MDMQNAMNEFLCNSPLQYTNFKQYSWGRILFDETNKESYSANHAVISSVENDDLNDIFNTIEEFYNSIGVIPKIFHRPDSISLDLLNSTFQKRGYNIRRFCINLMAKTLPSKLENVADCIIKKIDTPLSGDEYALEIEQDNGEDYGVLLLNRQIESGSFMFFAYNDSQKPVAMAMAECYKDLIYITDVYTSPTYRNQGFAGAIINKLIKYADENKKGLFLIASEEGPVRLYSKAGFTGSESDCWWALKGELPPWCK